MNLPADVAALLREALSEADHLSGFDDRKAYRALADTIDNLLMPCKDEGDCYCGSPASSHRLGMVEHSYQRRPQADDLEQPRDNDPRDWIDSDLPF